MTLKEAIKHAEEVAELNENIAYNTEPENWMDIAQCEKCAEEHRQLAEWLRELKERREQPEIIRCKDCKHKGTRNCVANTWTTIFGFGVKDDFYCGLAGRRTDDKTNKGSSC